ncbi:hypothetical protein P0D71_21095 [Paraburkholderia sp. RL17-383-BIF-A]|jgi:hypothetical protein|uniref:hypothetical protein n=1 Tax=Paraburkholderia sp. RL17-383-BIF-A TaxID=3031631 RepID=UPI0038BA37EC
MNKRSLINIATYTALIVMSAIAGLRTTYLIDMLPMEMPESVEAFIRFWLSCTGTEYLGNPDDMEVLAFLLYWAVATLLIAVALIGFKRWLSRYLIARKSGEAIPKMPLSVTLVACSFALLVMSNIGWQLSSPLTRYPLHIPAPVKAVVKFYLSATGQGAGSDLDENLILYVMDLYWAIATLCIGVPVVLCCLAIRRFMRRKTS